MLHDPLTQLPNRTLFSDRLEQALALVARRNSRLAVVAVSLVDFQQVLDAGGELLADKALVQVAKRLQQDLRDTDTVCRLEGANFLVLLPDVGTVEAVEAIAEELRLHVGRDLVVAGHSFRLRCETGISLYPDHGSTERALVSAAQAQVDAQLA